MHSVLIHKEQCKYQWTPIKIIYKDKISRDHFFFNTKNTKKKEKKETLKFNIILLVFENECYKKTWKLLENIRLNV